MNAHPAIQPTDWSITPGLMAQNAPARRAQIYRLIWETTIAATLRAPLLNHTRILLDDSDTPVVACFRTPDTNQMGYWRMRTDWPRLRWPASRQEPIGPSYAVISATVQPFGQPSVTHLLERMEAHGIGTAASAAHLVTQMVADRPGGRWADIDDTTTGLPLRITAAGRAQLTAWADAGIAASSADTKRQQRVFDAIERSEQSAAEGLAAVTGESPESLAAIAAAIEREVASWEGTARRRDHHLDAAGTISPPKVANLPAGADPERHLPADHPLRGLREQVERDLFDQDTLWTQRAPQEQARRRLAWMLQHHAEESGAILHPPERARFSVLAYWLIGLNPENPWPEDSSGA